MKLTFSTNGWSEFSKAEFLDIAKDLGLYGVEFHQSSRDVFRGETGEEDLRAAERLKRELNQTGLAVPCYDIVLDAADSACIAENTERILHAVRLCEGAGIPYLRIAARDQIHGDAEAAETAVRDCLAPVIEYAEKGPVCILMETAGIYKDTGKLRLLLNEFASDSLAALWDVHHPYRFGSEDPETTVQNLGAYIRHVHIKDSLPGPQGPVYALVGEGDIPLDSMMNALRSINFDGSLSLEWLPGWMPELADPAIVFPHFVHYMSRYDESARSDDRLYDNKAGTGKYLWKKDALIDLTFSQILDRVVSEFPDQVVFHYTMMDYTRTYAEFRRDVDEFARSLIALGVKQGDKVTVWATNVPQWYVAFWAVTKIGAVLVTMNTAYKIHEAEYLLRQSDTHTLIMIDGFRDSDYVGIIRELCPELERAESAGRLHCKRLPFLRNIITVSSSQKGCYTWEEALAAGRSIPLEEVGRRATLVDKHDVCNMQYTSGTTGFPKGVMLTHYNIVNNGKCIGDRMDLSTADRMLIQVPMFHCFGMVLAMAAAMTHGSTMMPLPYFSPKPALACINQERITCIHGVPTMFIALLEHEDFSKTDFSHMRTGIMAGSLCPISVMRDVVNKMNLTEITIVFGQTESSPGCTMSSTDDPLEVRVSTVGRPLPQIECRIVDPVTNRELPPGEIGEFVARGYNIMKGYYKMPRATATAVDKDGWLHTGDLAMMTQEGNFCITGRLKDMIIRGGENIYPKEIEEFVYNHPKVADVQVIGVPDKQYGEEIMACVILKEGQTATAEEVQEYIRAHMARHKVPKYVEFVDSFPMNAAGKILKYKMRTAAVDKLGLYEAANVETA